MKQDLKDSTFSFKDLKRKKSRQKFRLVIISLSLILLIILISSFLTAKKCRKLEQLLLDNQLEKAGSILNSIKNYILI